MIGSIKPTKSVRRLKRVMNGLESQHGDAGKELLKERTSSLILCFA
jgi:hypothetical protein